MGKEILSMTPEAFLYYKTEVKNNEDTDYVQACKKMTRNIILAKEFAPEKVKKYLGKTTYIYGNLVIKTKGKKVVSLVNHKGTGNKLNIDRKRYIELSKELGIK